MVAFRTCTPILWSAGSGYDFSPWRCGFPTALRKADFFELCVLEYSNNAFLFAALLCIRKSFRNTVQSVCRMYTFSLLIIFQLALPSQWPTIDQDVLEVMKALSKAVTSNMGTALTISSNSHQWPPTLEPYRWNILRRTQDLWQSLHTNASSIWTVAVSIYQGFLLAGSQMTASYRLFWYLRPSNLKPSRCIFFSGHSHHGCLLAELVLVLRLNLSGGLHN